MLGLPLRCPPDTAAHLWPGLSSQAHENASAPRHSCATWSPKATCLFELHPAAFSFPGPAQAHLTPLAPH